MPTGQMLPVQTILATSETSAEPHGDQRSYRLFDNITRTLYDVRSTKRKKYRRVAMVKSNYSLKANEENKKRTCRMRYWKITYSTNK